MKISFHTLGCKLNFTESSSIANMFRMSGHEIADVQEKADVVVINSCAVTDSAEKKCKALIRQLRRRHPHARIVVIGCFSQLEPETLASMPEVDIVVGNEQKFDLPHILSDHLSDKPTGAIHNTVIAKTRSFVPGYSRMDRTRTFLKIQDGCNYHCTYCTIPKARGRSRSGTIKETLSLIQQLDHQKVGEIVLTGVNIGDFGRPAGESLVSLLRQLSAGNLQTRIRIGSIEPDLLSDEMIRIVANTPSLMPHFHLPLQAGTNEILQRMKRKYTTEIFAERVYNIREYLPDAFIACDVITGFPGETDRCFEQGYAFIASLPLSALHVFTFSERKDTPATSMEGKIPMSTRRERTNMLRLLSDQKKKTFYQQNTGSQREVLFESVRQNNQISGFTDNYIRVSHPWDDRLVHQRAEVMLGPMEGEYMQASLIMPITNKKSP